MMAFIGSLILASLINEVFILKTENNSFRDQLQLVKEEKRQLQDEKAKLDISFRDQLHSVKEEKQQLLDDKTKLENFFRDQLQSVKEEKEKLQDEKTKSEIFFRNQLQSITDKYQKLLDEKDQLLKRIDQINAYYDVYSTQILYIQSWMTPVEKLLDHIYQVIHCSERRELCRKIEYDFDENHANEIIIKTIHLIMKFKKQYKKFLNALLFKRIEEMKTLQATTNMETIEETMKEFIEEVSGFKYQRNKIKGGFEHQSSQERAVQKEGRLYKFGKWVFWMAVDIVKGIYQYLL